MDKKEFLKKLKQALINDIDQAELVNYYDELIDEAVLNGEYESDVVARLGSISDIVSSMGKESSANIRTYNKRATSKFIWRIIGLIGYLFLALFLVSLIFSGGIAFFTNMANVLSAKTSAVMFYYVFQMIIAFAVILIASSVLVNIIKRIKSNMNWLSSAERNQS